MAWAIGQKLLARTIIWACKATAATIYIIQLFSILHNCLYCEQIVTFLFANHATLSYANNKRPSVASSMITTITSPHWGVFMYKQMLFYSLFCAIIINDNRVCRVVLPSFSMNGGDVYGTILFSRLNVFWNVHDSIAYVHYFEHKKVILDIEKPPLNFAG